MYVLLVDNDADYDVADVHGPFDSVEEAQVYARDYRREHGIPGNVNVEPTPEENEAWTNEGWYFGIFEPIRLTFPL